MPHSVEQRMSMATERAVADAVAKERRRCAALAGSRKVHGYVADIGCYHCFARIVSAIERGEQPGG